MRNAYHDSPPHEELRHVSRRPADIYKAEDVEWRRRRGSVLRLFDVGMGIGRYGLLRSQADDHLDAATTGWVRQDGNGNPGQTTIIR